MTLIEIIAVVVIIGLIIGIAGPIITDQINRGRVGAARAQIASIEQGLENFMIDCGFYPQSPEPGLQALVQEPTVGRRCRAYSSRGYIRGGSIPLDPWGNEYLYVYPSNRPGTAFDIYSPGPDGVPDTEDDIGNWPMDD